jgi:CDP-paratose 2-epimerase
VRDILFIEDMLTILDLEISKLPTFRGEVFNAGGGAPNSVSLCEATAAMKEISSRSTPITQSEKVRQGDIALYFTDNRKALKHFGWQPQIDLRAGFTRIFEWIRENQTELRGRYAPSSIVKRRKYRHRGRPPASRARSLSSSLRRAYARPFA